MTGTGKKICKEERLAKKLADEWLKIEGPFEVEVQCLTYDAQYVVNLDWQGRDQTALQVEFCSPDVLLAMYDHGTRYDLLQPYLRALDKLVPTGSCW
jgi:hypothetical protein